MTVDAPDLVEFDVDAAAVTVSFGLWDRIVAGIVFLALSLFPTTWRSSCVDSDEQCMNLQDGVIILCFGVGDSTRLLFDLQRIAFSITVGIFHVGTFPSTPAYLPL